MASALIPAAATIGTSLLGQDASRKDAKRARQLQQQALAEFSGMQAPSIEDQKLFYDQLTSAGILSPELEQAITLGPSAMETISVDPRLKSQQIKALEQLAGVAETGMTPADQAAFELARRNAAQENQAMQGQIIQQMQARGQGGSGTELITRIKGAQSATDRLQQAQLEQAKAQQQLRMQAMNNVGSLSGQIRQQEFSEQSDIKRAEDLIRQFNANNLSNAQKANAQAKNLAQQQNLRNQQDIMNQNVALRNQQQQYNKELQQRQFENQMNIARGKSGQLQNLASAAQDRAANTAGMYGTIGQGIGSMASGYYQQQRADQAQARDDARFQQILDIYKK